MKLRLSDEQERMIAFEQGDGDEKAYFIASKLVLWLKFLTPQQ